MYLSPCISIILPMYNQTIQHVQKETANFLNFRVAKLPLSASRAGVS